MVGYWFKKLADALEKIGQAKGAAAEAALDKAKVDFPDDIGKQAAVGMEMMGDAIVADVFTELAKVLREVADS